MQLRKEERAKQRQWQTDRVRYGKTDSGNYVDQRNLEQLMSLGYEMALAAEALRQVGVSMGVPVAKVYGPGKSNTSGLRVHQTEAAQLGAAHEPGL